MKIFSYVVALSLILSVRLFPINFYTPDNYVVTEEQKIFMALKKLRPNTEVPSIY